MRVRIAFRAQGVGYVFKLYYVARLCLLYSWSLVYPFDVWRGMQENAGRCVMCVRGDVYVGDWDGTAVRDDTDTGSCVDWIGSIQLCFLLSVSEFLAAVCDSVVQARQDGGSSAAARTDASASASWFIVHCLSKSECGSTSTHSRGGQI